MKRNISSSNTLIVLISAFFSIILLVSTLNCSERHNSFKIPGQNEEDVKRASDSRSSVQVDTVLKYKPVKPIKYKALATKKIKSLTILKNKYGIDGTKLILALNRLDEKDFRKTDTLIIPDTIANILSYSPFPYIIEEARSVPKLILISRKIQAIAAYENGALVRWGPTSTGRKAKPTPEGLFSMNWKSKKTTSTIDSEWVLPFYFNFYNKEGVAIHQFDMPGYPASHACVRLLENDAKWFFYWAEQWILGPEGNFAAHGTPVIVFNEYGWGKRRPWRGLLENPYSASVPKSEIDSLMNKYQSAILERVEKRKEVIAEIKNKKSESQMTDIRVEPKPMIKDPSTEIKVIKN